MSSPRHPGRAANQRRPHYAGGADVATPGAPPAQAEGHGILPPRLSCAKPVRFPKRFRSRWVSGTHCQGQRAASTNLHQILELHSPSFGRCGAHSLASTWHPLARLSGGRTPPASARTPRRLPRGVISTSARHVSFQKQGVFLPALVSCSYALHALHALHRRY
jgi:hypothetical protein